MLHAEAIRPVTPASFMPAAFQSLHQAVETARTPEPLFEVTHSTVQMLGSNLWREQFDVALGQMVEAIALAELRGKSELLVTDITPWVKIGKDDPTEVTDTEERIRKIIVDACVRLKREIPEIRLNLRGGKFDLRCYLGREKPSDYVCRDDWISDSR